ncbi:GNAT family N-acetyltransferase [Ruminococcus sp.]|uniref:GNAT family N-acetyltransferase n=1 Tax=Ruminococcus TaxID=1263 RepID=UPI00093260A3|nr:GNAT family N-acetyltransferase [Ruminococcus sp.]
MKEILHHAFYNLNRHRLELECLAGNTISSRLYEHCRSKKKASSAKLYLNKVSIQICLCTRY